MSDPIQDIMRQLYWAGTRIAMSASGGIELTGEQPPQALMDAVKANRDALLARMRDQEIGHGQDRYPNAPPFRYTVPHCCLADKHCRRRGLCPEHLHGRRCGTNTPEDSDQEATEDEAMDDAVIGQTAQNIMALSGTQFFELTQELLSASPNDPNIEIDTAAWLVAMARLMTETYREGVLAA